ncbi:hypothetical protein ACC758_38200, partial [Rhizobium ruizarguesonis]
PPRLPDVAALHNSLNRNRFRDKIMQKLKVLQRPLSSEKTRGAVKTAFASLPGSARAVFFLRSV